MRVFLVPAIVVILISGMAARDVGAPRTPAQTPPAVTTDSHPVVRLWPKGAPGSDGWTQKEIEFGNRGSRGVRNVVDPTITVFLPDAATATYPPAENPMIPSFCGSTCHSAAR